MPPVPLRQRLRPAHLAAVAVVTATAALGGCGDDAGDAATTTTAAPVATTTTGPESTAAPSTSAEVDVATTAPPTTVPADAAASDQVPDGTNFGYVTSIDIGGSSVTIDIAELLTGDAAVKAAIEDGALDAGETSIDNDYYIRNRNPKLRTAPVAPTASVNVLASPGSPDLEGGDLQALAVSLTTYVGDEGPRLPVQIVATGGVITRIDEVFFP